jgi:sec-independent protein translocase protein TatB
VFGINGSEFIVLLVVAAVVLGPERLPQYAQQLARLVRELRRMAQGASAQMREELGPEYDDIDWRKLDPRQYDPRRIVREALSDSLDPDDPLGMRGAGLDRASLGLDDDGMKPVSRGGPGERRRPARPRPAENAANGAVNGATAAKPAVDDVPLDPDAT